MGCADCPLAPGLCFLCPVCIRFGFHSSIHGCCYSRYYYIEGMAGETVDTIATGTKPLAHFRTRNFNSSINLFPSISH